jgi:hypothetical protein
LEIRGVTELVSPEGLTRQSESFRAFLGNRFRPEAVWRKYMLEGLHGQRLLKLEADFFLENAEQSAVVLLAPFADGMKKWRQHAQALAPVLGWWRVMLRQRWSDELQSSGQPAKEVQFWVVFPIEGQAVEVRF